MKFTGLMVVLGGLTLAGCGTVADTVDGLKARVDARTETRVRNYAAPPRATYAAVRLAAERMGYRFLRGGPAQGELEAVSGIAQGDRNRSSRQVAMKVRLHATPDGAGTEVSVRFSEIIEADSANRAGQATETPLRDTPQYEVFFRQLQQALDSPKP